MKNKILKAMGAAAGVFGVYMAFGWSFFDMMVRYRTKQDLVAAKRTRKKWFQLNHNKVNHPRHRFEQLYEDGKAWCKEQNMQDCYMRSNDGLMLHAYYLPAADEAKRYVILCHGYKGSGFGDFANMAKFLHLHNCNLLFIDERCCGMSEGEYITFGAMEQYDVQGWAYYIADRDTEQLPIYLYGESMGAASVLMASGQNLPREVAGLISDCGFQSMRGQLKDMALEWFRIKHIDSLLFRVNLFCAVVGGFHMKAADTRPAMRTNTRPILFFHGGRDTYVSPMNTRMNYAVCKAPKELVIVPGARHLCSNYVAPELYRSKVLQFFAKYDHTVSN